MARFSKGLKEISEIFNDYEAIKEDDLEELEIDREFIYDLKENAIYIVEQREIGKVLHSIESVLLTLIFALLANCNTFVQIYLFMKKHYEWLDKHIKYENGLPSLSTIKRVVSFVNPKELEEWCNKSVLKFLKDNEPLYKNKDLVIEDIKSMDGKTANSSDRNSSKNGKLAKTNAMSIVSIKNDYCEATEFISDKTNEIPTGPDLLKRVNIKNCIITFDAMSTQTETIKYIAENGGYYVAPVKGNQATLEENIKNYFDDTDLCKKAKKENYLVVKEKAHGVLEKREYIFTNDIGWLYNKDEWIDIKSIGIATRTYENSKGEVVIDTRYFISNIDAGEIKILSKSIRNEWMVENGLHYFLDTVFKEDDSSSFVENTQKNLNILRKFCLKILKVFKTNSKLSMNSIRFNISMDFENEIDNVISSLYK